MARDHGPFARAVSEPAHTSEAGWVTARQVAAEFDENAEAIAILKQATPVGIFFLLAYMIVDARAHVVTSGLIVSPYHWFALVTVLLFFGLTWLPGFRTHWRLWVLLCCITMIALMVQVGAATHDPDTGYLTIVLCPFAAAAFVVWGGRWQLILNLACLLIYTVAELAVPGGSRFEIHRALGMVAALTLAQFTAVFLDRYRRRLKGQLGQLAAAAEFRETQIATMTHDIRNPLATLVGLMTLLAENETGEKERARLLARMSSTTVSMDLIVKNLLDLYMLEEQHMRPNCRVIDVDAVVSETAERYAFEARQRGLRFAIEPGGVHQAKLDPLHLERIVANLVTSAVQRTEAGAVRIRTSQPGEWIEIEVSDCGPATDVARIFERPAAGEDAARSTALGRYIARALVEADGGVIRAQSGEGWGLSVIARLPAASPPT